MWKLHVKLLEENRKADPGENQKITKASDLKIGQLVFVKDHYKGTFDLTYIFDHRIAGIINDSTVLLPTLDGKGTRCNIHYIKPVTALQNGFLQSHIQENQMAHYAHVWTPKI